MLKIGLLCGVIAAMSLAGAKSQVDNKKAIESKSCDTKFIVELTHDIESITEEVAISEQNALLSKIQNKVNANSKMIQHYSLLNNAFVISGNKLDIEAIKELPGVKSVTEEGQRIVKEKGGPISIEIKQSGIEEGEDEVDLTKNASALTMHKPDDTNDGEGTLIAVLDNEFYLRNDYIDEETGEKKEGFHHETFDPMTDDVNVRLTYGKVKELTKEKKTFAQRKVGVLQNEEGSLYFNNKVPFYYDYAGDSHNGSDNGIPADPVTDVPYGDYNVYSDIALHGSHVASIAAGNARFGHDGEEMDGYKGIAPKAQLVCMKVFSDLYASDFDKNYGSGDGSRFSEIGFLNALEDCMKLGVDAINVSIGSDLNDFDMDSIVMRTLNKLTTENHILSSISEGNGGKASYAFTGAYGNWTRDVVETGVSGSYANNRETMSIASGQPIWTYYENSLLIGNTTIPYNDQIVNRDESAATKYDEEHELTELVKDGEEILDIDVPYVYVGGFGGADCYKNKDVAGKIAVTNRGSIDFAEKYRTAANEQALALIIINNDPTESDFTFTCDFGDETPRIPVCLVLFKDKPFFEANREGTLKIKSKTSAVNTLARTVSDFSTDGPAFDLDLKPEITTPGSNIKGAVTPQNKEERKEENRYHSYEYFNGTSMAAPNYEGAMAVLLSKVTKDMVADGDMSKDELALLDEYKQSVNMKFMSTADIMTDHEANDENHEISPTSPRMQGAGMADINGAYHTDTYLEGLDENGNGINKSKILLRNNEDIAKGDVKLSFLAHNESEVAHNYKAKVTVMRPAIAKNNTILTDDYNLIGEIDTIKNFPGYEYYSPEQEKLIKGEGAVSYKDVIHVTKDILYYTSQEEVDNNDPKGIVKEGFYYVCSNIQNSTEGIQWKVVPNLDYQSIKDVVIGTFTQDVTLEPGDHEIKLNPYTLTKEAKDKIEELYEFGTYVEGFVELEAKDEGVEDLNIPFLGFYSLTDRHEDYDFSTAPVVEPFSFEKDPMKIYGSDLINDVTKTLLGKDNVNFGSMMVAGYTKGYENLNFNKIVDNSENIAMFNGFHEVGYKPDVSNEEMFGDPANNIYVGNPNTTNTLVVQQFVYRSVSDNYITIVNKATGEEVYRSALEDLLFGQDTNGKYTLYKSHVDADYLGGGYVAHRAYAVIPLYNALTHEAFASGEYELKFNYELASTKKWVSKSYTLHIDSEAPVVSSISEYKKGTTDMVRINLKDENVAYAVVGKVRHDVNYDKKNNIFYVELTKEEFESSLENKKTVYSENRLFVQAVDYARGVTNAIVHFKGEGYSNTEILQGYGLAKNYDFKYENDELKVIKIDSITGNVTNVEFNEDLKLVKAQGKKGGCGGSIAAASAIVTLMSLAGATLVGAKKKLGGKKDEE